MKRILVTGNAGSGKSTLARQTSEVLGIPYESLDRVVWQSGWKKTPPDERDRLITALVQRPSWVIDGVSYDVQDKADTVVFLDVPRRVSFWRVARRNWRYLFRSRPELPPHCPEILIIPKLISIIWNFPTRIRPNLLNRISDAQQFYHLRTEAERATFLTLLPRRGPDTSSEKTAQIFSSKAESPRARN